MKRLIMTTLAIALPLVSIPAMAGARLFVPLENENRILVIDTETGDQAYIGNANPDDVDLNLSYVGNGSRGWGITHDPVARRIYLVSFATVGDDALWLYRINADSLAIESATDITDLVLNHGVAREPAGDIELASDGNTLFFGPYYDGTGYDEAPERIQRLGVDGVSGAGEEGPGGDDGDNAVVDMVKLADGMTLYIQSEGGQFLYNMGAPDEPAGAVAGLSNTGAKSGIALTADGRYVYPSPLGVSVQKLQRYSVADQVMEDISPDVDWEGARGKDVAVRDNGARVYVLTSDGQLRYFRRASGLGVTQWFVEQKVSLAPSTFATVEITPDGSQLYVVSRANDAVYQLPLGADDGGEFDPGRINTGGMQTIDLAGAGVAPLYDGMEPQPPVTATAIEPDTDGEVLLAAVRGEGIYRIAADGSWQPRNGTGANTLPQRARAHVRALQYTSTDALYAVTDGGLYKSDDDGANWYPRNGGLGDRRVTSLSFLEPQGQNAIASTARGGVYETFNGGQTWSSISGGLPLTGDTP